MRVVEYPVMRILTLKNIFTPLVLFVLIYGSATAESISSPNGEIVLDFDLKDLGKFKNCPVYGVSWKGKPVLSESRLGFELKDGESLADQFDILGSDKSSNDDTWKPVYGERASVRNNFNSMSFKLVHTRSPVYMLNLYFRCYDEGVAFRYEFPGKDTRGEVSIISEETHFRFLDNHETWCVYSAQGEYEKKKIKNMGSGVERPLTVKIEENRYAAIAEAGLVDYARMKLCRSEDDSNCMVSELSGDVVSTLPLKTPWRVVMLAESPGELLENNDIILNLNEPVCHS